MGLSEGLQLRVRDQDFTDRAIIVRQGKGGNTNIQKITAARLQLPSPIGRRDSRADRSCQKRIRL